MHAALWEAVRAGLIFRLESAYTFLHDRIQQGAYSLIPEGTPCRSAPAHRARAAGRRMKTDELTEHLFEVANQFNRGAALLVDRDEQAQVATLAMGPGAGQGSAAYASAVAHFKAGMALLDERDWGSHYELTFTLWLERAECEYLSGNFEKPKN